MISLNNYISESIYGNLGIDDGINKEVLRDWLLSYWTSFGGKGCQKMLTQQNGELIVTPMKELDGDFIINTNPKHNLAPNGVLPTCCKDIKFSKNVYSICIKSDPKNPLKALDNLPDAFINRKNKYNKTIDIDLRSGVINDLDFCGLTDIILDVDLTTTKINGQLKNINNLSCIRVVRYNNLQDVINLYNSLKNVNTTSNFYLVLINVDRKPVVSGSLLDDYIKSVIKNKLYCVKPDDLEFYITMDSNNAWGIKPKNLIHLNSFIVGDLKFLKNINPKQINVININIPASPQYPIDELRLLPKGVILTIGNFINGFKSDVKYYESLPSDEFDVVVSPYDINIVKK